MPLAAGQLNTRVLVRRATTANVGGQVQATYYDAHGLWAELRGVSAAEQGGLGAGTLVRLRLRVRYGADLRADDRVVIAGIEYELVGPPIDVDGLRESLVVELARRGNGQ